MTDQDPTRDRPDLGPDLGPEPGPAFAPGEESDASAQEAPVPPEVVASLTDALRAMYDTVVDEPLPDAFANLLSRLDDSDG